MKFGTSQFAGVLAWLLVLPLAMRLTNKFWVVTRVLSSYFRLCFRFHLFRVMFLRIFFFFFLHFCVSLYSSLPFLCYFFSYFLFLLCRSSSFHLFLSPSHPLHTSFFTPFLLLLYTPPPPLGLPSPVARWWVSAVWVQAKQVAGKTCRGEDTLGSRGRWLKRQVVRGDEERGRQLTVHARQRRVEGRVGWEGGGFLSDYQRSSFSCIFFYQTFGREKSGRLRDGRGKYFETLTFSIAPRKAFRTFHSSPDFSKDFLKHPVLQYNFHEYTTSHPLCPWILTASLNYLRIQQYSKWWMKHSHTHNTYLMQINSLPPFILLHTLTTSNPTPHSLLHPSSPTLPNTLCNTYTTYFYNQSILSFTAEPQVYILTTRRMC